MRWFLVGAVVLAVSATAVPARAGLIVNAVSNGSFEDGFAGWTVNSSAGASNPGLGPQIVVTNGSTADEYGDKEVADNAATPDPDGAGTHAVYLVDDTATETLTQVLTLLPGIYEVGFDLLATGSGAGNTYDSTLSAVIAGVSVLSASVSQIIASDGTNTWTHYSANADIQEAGTYSVAFTFVGGAAPAKDLMLDQVYVETPTTIATAPVPIPVPEPATAVLFGAGLIGLLLARRRGWPFVGTAPAAALQARLPALPVRSRTPARTAAAKARRTRRRTATRRRRTVGVYPAMNPNFPAR